MYMTFAIVAFALAFAIRYWINRRRFNRRGFGGIEMFSSYEKAWTTRLGEGFLRIVSVALILLACFFFLGYCVQKHNEEKTTGEQPARRK
jgi:hypothetical protein